jgi:hypothetical protein
MEEAGKELQQVQNDTAFKNQLSFWVDNCTVAEMQHLFLFILAIAFGLLFFGFNGKPAVVTNASYREFNPDAKAQSFYFDASPVSQWGRFFQFELAFNRASASAESAPITLGYKIATYNWSAISTRTDLKSVQFSPRFSGSETLRIPLLKDQAIDYTSIELTLNFESVPITSYKGVTVYSSLGTRDLTYFQIFFRGIIGGFLIWGLDKLSDEVDFFAYLAFPLIMKFILPLTFLTLFSDNPLWFFHSFRSRGIFVFTELIFTPTFHAVTFFVILLILDSINRSDNLMISRALPKLAIATYKLVTGFIVSYNAASSAFNHAELGSINSLGSFYGLLDFIADLLFVGLGVYYLLKLLVHVGPSAPTKTLAYGYIGALFLAYVALIPILGRFLGLYKNTGIPFVFEFTIYNAVAVLLLLFHWPVAALFTAMTEVDQDGQFTNADEQMAAPVDQVLDLNEDWAKQEAEEDADEEEDKDEPQKPSK